MTELKHDSNVFLIDDDPLVLAAVKDAIHSFGYVPRAFSRADDLLSAIKDVDTGVIISDLQMPDLDGLQLQRLLLEHESDLSLIMLTAHADVPVTVEVMKNGATTLIEKPFSLNRLMFEIERALQISQQRFDSRLKLRAAKEAIEKLSPEELMVMDLAASGKPNKAISHELELSSRTVDRRRQSALRKLSIQCVSEFAVLRATAHNADPSIPAPHLVPKPAQFTASDAQAHES